MLSGTTVDLYSENSITCLRYNYVKINICFYKALIATDKGT